jgi:hypothetical protein
MQSSGGVAPSRGLHMVRVAELAKTHELQGTCQQQGTVCITVVKFVV